MPVQSVVVGVPFQTQVAARLPNGSTDTDFNGPITISLVDPGFGATLSGTLTQNAVDGVATFPGLRINRTGVNFQLDARSTGFVRILSNPFSVVMFGGAPSGWLYLPIPADATNVNIRQRFIDAFAMSPTEGNFPSGLNLFIEVLEGVTLAGSLPGTFGDPSAPAMYFDDGWTPNHNIILQNRGRILGAGGRGGRELGSTNPIVIPLSLGEPGGDAIELNGLTVIIDNTEGFIFGGGGGGGGGSRGVASANNLILNSFSEPYIGAVSFGVAPGGSGGGGAGPNDAIGGPNLPNSNEVQAYFQVVSGTSGTVQLLGALGTLSNSVDPSYAPNRTGSMSATIAALSVAGEDGGYNSETLEGQPGEGGIGGVVFGSGSINTAAGSPAGEQTRSWSFSAAGGKGGDGGDWGEDGEDGEDGAASAGGDGGSSTTYQIPSASGGAAGLAISLSGGEAIIVGGDTATRIKGGIV